MKFYILKYKIKNMISEFISILKDTIPNFNPNEELKYTDALLEVKTRLSSFNSERRIIIDSIKIIVCNTFLKYYPHINHSYDLKEFINFAYPLILRDNTNLLPVVYVMLMNMIYIFYNSENQDLNYLINEIIDIYHSTRENIFKHKQEIENINISTLNIHTYFNENKHHKLTRNTLEPNKNFRIAKNIIRRYTKILNVMNYSNKRINNTLKRNVYKEVKFEDSENFEYIYKKILYESNSNVIRNVFYITEAPAAIKRIQKIIRNNKTFILIKIPYYSQLLDFNLDDENKEYIKYMNIVMKNEMKDNHANNKQEMNLIQLALLRKTMEKMLNRNPNIFNYEEYFLLFANSNIKLISLLKTFVKLISHKCESTDEVLITPISGLKYFSKAFHKYIGISYFPRFSLK